jgi:ribosome maturation factor RimP
MEKKIAAAIEDLLGSLGFDLVNVKISGLKYKTIGIMLERQDGNKITVADCQLASRNISPLLDVEDIMQGKYFLEVSSAGIERPLVKEQDFLKFRDREIKIRLKTPMEDRLSLRGILLNYEDNKIYLKINDSNLCIDHDNVKSAKLVFSDADFRALLKKQEKQEKEKKQNKNKKD